MNFLQWVEPAIWGFCRALSYLMQGVGCLVLLAAFIYGLIRGINKLTNHLIEREESHYEIQD